MRILVLGSGAREHAIIVSLLAENAGHEIYMAPGHRTVRGARSLMFAPERPDLATRFAAEKNVDLVVIGPEGPLIAGVADALRAIGIPVFGPDKAAAQLEGSKAFAKRIMEVAQVPTGSAYRCSSLAEVETALDALGAPHVVKADGLAAGKGVLVTDERSAALAHAERYLPRGEVLVEEYLAGPEVSLFFLSDGHDIVPLSPAQDYKRLLDGDAGPNTGGMGAYSPLPWLADQWGSEAAFVDEVLDTIALPTIRTLEAEGTPFIGLLYCGLAITPHGIRVIEFNARFGDPETQVVLPRLETPLSALLMAAATSGLAGMPYPRFSSDVAIAVVLASKEYPEATRPGVERVITGLEEASEVPGVKLLIASITTDRDRGGAQIAGGGRILNVVATAPTFTAAREAAYEALSRIHLEGGQFRIDIAAHAARRE